MIVHGLQKNAECMCWHECSSRRAKNSSDGIDLTNIKTSHVDSRAYWCVHHMAYSSS